tara:strand:- start:64530 stop:65876 length:1347 start_codon:yes stop_codon:yes gene_type:complete
LWSRRQFLGALGASGAASALSPLLGCGAQTANKRSAATAGVRDDDLASALAILDAKLENATVWSQATHTDALSIDHDEERFDRLHEHLVVLSALKDKVPTQLVLVGPTPEQIVLAATSLSEHAIVPAMTLAPMAEDGWGTPWTRKHSDYRTPVRALFSIAQQHGGSRVVYRSAYLYSVHTEQRFLSRSKNLRSRSQRTRGGVVMGTWAHGEMALGHTQVSGLGGPALVSLSGDAIAQAADQALAHLHARSAPSGAQEVLLSPETAALLAYAALAKTATPLQGSYNVRIEDDPTTGYGAMHHDALGEAAVAHTLVGEEATTALLRLRRGNGGILRSEATNLRVDGDAEELASLVARIETGVLLEGPELCRLDSRGERLAIVCSRAREILKGRFTGRLFSRTLATANVREFFSNTVALGTSREAFAFDTDGIAGSAEAPHWLSRADVHKA